MELTHKAKPIVLKVRAPFGKNYTRIKGLLGDMKLATVAKRPNARTWVNVGVEAQPHLC